MRLWRVEAGTLAEGRRLSSLATTVALAGDPPRDCAALDPIAFRCGSRKTERQEKHAKDDGDRQNRDSDEERAQRFASLVTDLLTPRKHHTNTGVLFGRWGAEAAGRWSGTGFLRASAPPPFPGPWRAVGLMGWAARARPTSAQKKGKRESRRLPHPNRHAESRPASTDSHQPNV
jgi:hypothetical protein